MQLTLTNNKVINAKPFLKWAGGKTQLLEELEKRLPQHIIDDRTIENYVEPFVGGGAMFFYQKSTSMLKVHIYLILIPN
jgi:DNA adenine methylase